MMEIFAMKEEKVIRSILSKIKLPPEVKSVDLAFSDDSGGMSAVWINLHVAEDNRPSPDKVNRLIAARRDISRKIIEKQSSPWPYVKFVTN